MKSGGILAQIELALNELPISEKKVATYILSYPQDVKHMAIHELAKQSEASSSAVVRLCKSLGIDGFPSLKVRLSAELVNDSPVGYLDIESNENAKSIIEKTISNTVQTFHDTASQLDARCIEQTVKLLHEA